MHLVLSQKHTPNRLAVFANTPDAAIALLETGVVEKISFDVNWCQSADPEEHVAIYINQQVRAAEIPMLAWEIWGSSASLLALMEGLDAHCRERAQTPEWSVEKKRHALICGLNVDQKFDQLSCHAQNSIAYAYATLAALSAKSERNPLLILGPSNAGKTHFLNAAGVAFLEHTPKGNVKKIEATAFSVPQSLDRALAVADLVLIDNVHRIVGDDVAQEHIWSLGETLRARQRQVVFCCKSASGDLPDFSIRFREYIALGIAVYCQRKNAAAAS